MSEYRFDRRNSNNEVILRRNTKETLESVKAYLQERNIEYELKLGASMVCICYNGKKYAYYYTTGRWAAYPSSGLPKKHYRSNGIDDFITRFLINSKYK